MVVIVRMTMVASTVSVIVVRVTMIMAMIMIMHFFLGQLNGCIPISLEWILDLRADGIPSFLTSLHFFFRNETFVESLSNLSLVQRLTNDDNLLLAVTVDFVPKWSNVLL